MHSVPSSRTCTRRLDERLAPRAPHLVASFRAAAAATLAVVVLAPPLDAQLLVDPEVWVDDPADAVDRSDPTFPAVEIDRSGRRVVVWNADGDDGDDIWLRRMDASLQPLADPVRVNTTTAEDQVWPRVAVRPDGSFLVIWQSFEPDGTTDRLWIRGQLYDASAVKSGGELLISQLSTGQSTDASADVTALSNGAFAVVWEGYNSTGDDASSNSVHGRLVSANGALTGAQFQVNINTNGQQRDPTVAARPGGGFLVAWSSASVGGADSSGNSIQGLVFSNAGVAQGGQFQINTTAPSTQDSPDAASDGLESLMVVWQSPNAVTSRTQIFARYLAADGTPTGQDFQIHPDRTLDHQLDPRVASADRGRYMVTWHSDQSAGDDTDRAVQARVVAGEGQYEGPQFQVNAARVNGQEIPDVGGGRDGRLSVVFRDVANPFDPPNGRGILSRGYLLCLFCDDFESGDTTEWSSQVR